MLDAITSAYCVAWQDSYIPPGGGDQCMNAEQPECAKMWSEHWRDVQRLHNAMRDENERRRNISLFFHDLDGNRQDDPEFQNVDPVIAMQRQRNGPDDPGIMDFENVFGRTSDYNVTGTRELFTAHLPRRYRRYR